MKSLHNFITKKFPDEWAQLVPIYGIPAATRVGDSLTVKSVLTSVIQLASVVTGVIGLTLTSFAINDMPKTNQQYNQLLQEGLPPAPYEQVQSISRERWVRKLNESDYTTEEIRELVRGKYGEKE
ncbi:hypothetical protein HN832_02540 [archaeon]|nr:hypothetical protein [archaeon]MBT4373232.1 hypothetical protein [archaeon]MBT4531577.1 hypothetical protein [archaeon]MBT7001245.1 hypothetical protein [archaeon]MBT7282269.1 hypothetical protein [archaeon]